MVAATYDAAMVRVFADEGGYTNDPKDPGGATNWGITIFDARKYWKSDATAADVKEMPKPVASGIYKKHYAAPVRYDDLPAGFDYSVFDAGINSGIGRAIPWACKSLGIAPAGIDAVVPKASASPDKVALIKKYWALRLSFLHGLKTWSHFGAGWGRRCAQGEAAAVKMWLTIGVALPSTEVSARMKQEAAAASSAANKDVVKTATATGGTATGALDWTNLGGKVALCCFIAAVIIAAIYFGRQAMINNQRAAAYLAA